MSDKLTKITMRGGNEAIYIGKRRVGTIVMIRTPGEAIRYQYRPKGSTHIGGGSLFDTRAECFASLVGE